MVRSIRCIPIFVGTSVLMFAAGCSHAPTPAPVGTQPCPVAYAPAPAPTAIPAPAPVAPPQAALTPTGPTVIVVKDAGLQTPECALWDADQDVYFVSNINGAPTAVDQNGFISKIGPDGKVLELKFVDGTKKSSELNAPKGLAIAGKILYVADLDTVRMFDRKSGKPRGKIAIKNAVFLNALTVSPDGKVLYVSDSAVKIKDGNFSGTGGDAIFEIDLKKRAARPLVQDKALRWPNGVLADSSGVWVVTLGANELIHVNYKGEIGAITKLPKGGLDGIVRLADGSLLISSWEGSAIYRGLPGGEFREVISGVPSPAAIGLDSKRRAVLIPGFMASTFEAHVLPILPVLEAPVLPPPPPPPPAPAAKPAVAPAAAPAAVPAHVPAQAPAPAQAKPATPPPAAAPVPAHAPAPAPAPAPGYAPSPAPSYAPAPAPAPAPAAAPAPAPAAAPAPAPAAAPAPASSGPHPARWQ
jgi:sugar lactone lactonase YvrE